MDDSLRQWCDDSFAELKNSWCSTTQFDAPTAELLIEIAAFTKLAQSRGFEINETRTDGPIKRRVSRRLIAQLIVDCPCHENDPPEVLGSIHEYLVSNRHQVRAQHTSAPRKLSGVFYTPQHVIDYIVDRTLMNRLKTKSPEQIEKLTILDPACGCGAFLATAYRALLDWRLNWYQEHHPDRWPDDVVTTSNGWQLTHKRCRTILLNQLYGVDLDARAIQVARRTLWLILFEKSASASHEPTSFVNQRRQKDHLRSGHALLGPAFGQVIFEAPDNRFSQFDWAEHFPRVARQGGFDFILGNPPYRRERDYKQELDAIAKTPLGQFRSPRMDLWYYFVHRGIELLHEGGTLSFITNAYWTQGAGAQKLRKALRDDVHLDELFLLQDQPLFQGVNGRHMILTLTKPPSSDPIVMKIAPALNQTAGTEFVTGVTPVYSELKTPQAVFLQDRINVWPSADALLAKLDRFPSLETFGVVRQGIAENPAAINRRTMERYSAASKHWSLGEGVFSLSQNEVQRLKLSQQESALLRPYHDLCDLGRYWSAAVPSKTLIYSTRSTCPSITPFPKVRSHLQRFRPILESRRETANGSNRWWHLHWPRDEKIWLADKLVALQMAPRPSFVPAFGPTYVSFSANVFVPSEHALEDLNYYCGLLNSKILWVWFEYRAKHRGVGLEINGHVLVQAPIRKIDFASRSDVALHDELVTLVRRRTQSQQNIIDCQMRNEDRQVQVLAAAIENLELEIDDRVADLYGLDRSDTLFADQMTREKSLSRSNRKQSSPVA